MSETTVTLQSVTDKSILAERVTPKRTMKGDVLRVSDSANSIEGYLVRFTEEGDADLHGEYFSKSTDFWLERGYDVKGKPVLLEHGLDSAFKWIPVGIIEKCTEDEIGLWIEARLHDRAYYEQMLKDMHKKGYIPNDDALDMKAELMAQAVRAYVSTGKVGWSSGALPQSVESDERGHIKSWAIIEGSITMTPAEPDGTDIAVKRSALQELQTMLSSITKSVPDTPALKEDARPIEVYDTADNNHLSYTNKAQGTVKMEISEILALVGERLGMVLQELAGELSSNEAEVEEVMAMADEEEIKAEVEEEVMAMDEEEQKSLTKAQVTSIVAQVAFKHLNRKKTDTRKSVKSAVSAAIKAQPLNRETPAPSKAGGGYKAGDIRVKSWFAKWTPEDYSYALTLAPVRNNQGKPLSSVLSEITANEDFRREFAGKTLEAHERGQISLEPHAVKSVYAMKANELDHSTQAGFGDEWVPTVWSDNIWDKPRLDNVIQNILESIEMPSNPYEYAIEGADPTVYYVPETTAETELLLSGSGAVIPDTKIGTGKTTFTATKLALRVGISAELQEDAIAKAIPKMREQAQRTMLNAVDSVSINGDTATTGNINSDGETISTNLNRNFLANNGLLKQGLVTASSNAYDAGNTSISLAHIRSALALLDPAVAYKVSEMVLVVDPYVYQRLKNIDEIVTLDKAGQYATVLTGTVGFIDGMPVHVSEQMAQADSDGKITETANVVNRGRAFLVHRPSWKLGYRRHVQQAFDYLSYYDAWQLTMTVRFDIAGRTQGASDNTVAVLYNLAI